MFHTILVQTPTNRPRYIDSSCRPMGMTESLYEYALNSGNPAIHPDRLYRCARLWGRCFWGTQYPDQEVTDDIENYRALELLHADMMLRHKTWQALMNDPVETAHQAKPILKEIMAIREVRHFPYLLLTVEYELTIAAILRSIPNSQIRRIRLPPAALSSPSTSQSRISTPKSSSTADSYTPQAHHPYSTASPCQTSSR